jgi:methionine-rich copper-binding protein CopC
VCATTVTPPFRAAVVIGLFGVLGVLVGASPVVWAHSTLLAASPGPGAIVGGSIDTVTLQYQNEVVEFRGGLTGPGGSDVDSSVEIVNSTRVTITLTEPLSRPGEYAVRHATRSSDTDLVEAAFLFTFDPSAPPPVFLEVPSDDRRGWLTWAVGAIGTAVVAVLAWRLVAAIRRRPNTS